MIRQQQILCSSGFPVPLLPLAVSGPIPSSGGQFGTAATRPHSCLSFVEMTRPLQGSDLWLIYLESSSSIVPVAFSLVLTVSLSIHLHLVWQGSLCHSERWFLESYVAWIQSERNRDGPLFCILKWRTTLRQRGERNRRNKNIRIFKCHLSPLPVSSFYGVQLCN